MATERAWLASRHLRESEAGARALELIETMEPAARDALLARTDTLAAQSVGLAHVYFSTAVPARVELGPAFEQWERAGLAILGHDGGGRDAAQSYFRMPAGALMRCPIAVRERWLEAVLELLDISRRLGSAFVTATGPALGEEAHPTSEVIDAWRAAIKGTLEHGGWRGEFLAASLIESTSTLMALLEPEAIDAWSEVTTTIGSAGRSPRIPKPPSNLDRLERAHRTGLMRVAARAATHDATVAAGVLDALPEALSALPEPAAASLVDALLSAEIGHTMHSELPGALALVPAVVHELPAEFLAELYALVPIVGAGFAPGLVPYLRAMDRAYEAGGIDGVHLWVERGIKIGEGNADAGVAHFRMQTRTAHKILSSRSAAVTFEEVEPMLMRLIVMLSRRSFQLMTGPGIWMRPILCAPEDTAIRLPERVDLWNTAEENLLMYKLGIAHIAGRWEFGTYDFSLEQLTERGWTPPLPEETERDDIIGLMESFPNPLLAAALFILIDGARIDAALERAFPGMARDLVALGRAYAAHSPPAAQDRHSDRLLEAFFRMSVGRESVEELEPRLRKQGARLASTLEVLRAPDATVYDSAALLIAYYGSLTWAHALAGDEDGAALFHEIGGATVIDPFEHLDYEDAPFLDPTGNAATGSSEGTEREETVEGELDLQLTEGEDRPGASRPLTAEELKELLESGADFSVSEEHGEVGEGLGLYITDLLGKLPAEALAELRERLRAGDTTGVRAWLTSKASSEYHLYDEWDYKIGDYRRRWCRLHEIEADADTGAYFTHVLTRSDDLIQRIKHEFQVMRPEQFRKVMRMQDGEDVDFNAMVEAHADRRTRRTPSDRVYVARRREERDVATLFLLDMSASTDEPLPACSDEDGEPRRVIDLTKDTLAILSQVLEEVGDSYALYGFSGHGRDNVEYYRVKSFGERLGDHVKARIGGIEPKRSTRMGAALRHSAEKLARVNAKAKHLILLSDGFPQDYDYGEDRRSNTYGIRDTMTALQELEKQSVRTFCITVDPSGHDYLGDMCPATRYAVIEDIRQLPEELPRIYRQVTKL